MKAIRVFALATAFLAATAHTTASGLLGVYAIVDRVVFEPDETAPERIQLHGSFTFVNGAAGGTDVSPAAKGYMYFKLPTAANAVTEAELRAVKAEWADLKAVAGTGQAVAFGSWGFIGGFSDIRPAAISGSTLPYVLERVPRGGSTIDMRVRPTTERPVNAATYQTNAGIVKLSATGSHAAIVSMLKAAKNPDQ